MVNKVKDKQKPPKLLYMFIKIIARFLLMIMVVSCSNTKQVDYYSLPIKSSTNNINAVIEIPVGTNKKYEYNKSTKTFEIDKKDGKERVVDFLSYVGNYGYIPSTYSDPKVGGDGDALDVLVISESVPTGTILDIKPIGVLKLIDAGEFDYKIIAVPVKPSKQIIKAQNFKELSENYPIAKKIIEMWFLNYNPSDEAKIDGWGNEDEALSEILNSKSK